MPAPPRWSWVALSDAARLESGHTPSRKFASYWNGGIPWIGIKDAREHHGRKILDTLQAITQEGLDNSAARLLPPGTVCLSRTASVGYVLVMGTTMATSQDFVNWICSEAIVPEFLMHILIAERESLRRFGKGTTHTTIYYPEVKALHVCLPPVGEQHRIVAAIESYFTRLDDAVATLERVQRNLKRYRASVLKAAVEGRLVPTEADLARAEGRDYEPASVLLERILTERRRRWQEAELAKMKAKGKAPKNDKWKARYKEPVAPDTDGLPEVPDGWCWTTAEALSDEARSITYGVVKLGDVAPGGVPTLRSSNVRHLRLGLDYVKPISRRISAAYQRTVLGGGEVLVTVRGTLGGVIAVPSSCAGFNISREVAMIALVEPSIAQLVATFIGSTVLQNWMLRRTRGIAYTGLNISTLKLLPVPIPPLAEQARIVAAVEHHLSIAGDTEGACTGNERRCQGLRQSILKWAFEGKLADQDPNDEPASVLLKRIKAEREAAAPTKKTKTRRRRKVSAKKA